MRRAIMVGGAGLALLICLNAYALTAAELRFESMIRNELPPNPTQYQVEQLLYGKRLNYTQSGGENPVITVTVEHSTQNYLVLGTLHVTFVFNQNNILVSHTVKEDLSSIGGAEDPSP